MFFPREFPEPEELAELLAELDLSEAVDFQKITLALRWVKILGTSSARAREGAEIQ